MIKLLQRRVFTTTALALGLAALCIGGGMGTAVIVRKV